MAVIDPVRVLFTLLHIACPGGCTTAPALDSGNGAVLVWSHLYGAFMD